MKLYETKTWKLIVNRSHKDCMEYACNCRAGKPYRLWLKNKLSPVNSVWWEFPCETSAIQMALELKPEIIAYETHNESSILSENQ